MCGVSPWENQCSLTIFTQVRAITGYQKMPSGAKKKNRVHSAGLPDLSCSYCGASQNFCDSSINSFFVELYSDSHFFLL